jgi:hypothetical protein
LLGDSVHEPPVLFFQLANLSFELCILFFQLGDSGALGHRQKCTLGSGGFELGVRVAPKFGFELRNRFCQAKDLAPLLLELLLQVFEFYLDRSFYDVGSYGSNFFVWGNYLKSCAPKTREAFLVRDDFLWWYRLFVLLFSMSDLMCSLVTWNFPV